MAAGDRRVDMATGSGDESDFDSVGSEVIEQAVGVLMVYGDVDAGEARRQLMAMAADAPLRRVAARIVEHAAQRDQ